MHRKRTLSDWLKNAVAPSVETDLRKSSNARSSNKLFTILSGNQIERACDTALESGDVYLATLLAQADGEPSFRNDIQAQLEVWKTQQTDAHIDSFYRRIYALLAGIPTSLAGSKRGGNQDSSPLDVFVAEGLDWKRAFGLHLWYGSLLDAPASEALDEYLDACEGRVAAPPLPWYREDRDSAPQLLSWANHSSPLTDGLFELIKLGLKPLVTLETALAPRGFSLSPSDYRLPWHLYNLLSRVMRRRDFSDRREVGHEEQDEDTEGTSNRANRTVSNYAFQLEYLGKWELATFVLLHLEEASR